MFTQTSLAVVAGAVFVSWTIEAGGLVRTYFLYASIQSEAISRYAVFRSNWPATAAGIADGDWVVLETAMARVWLKAKCNDELHPGEYYAGFA